MNNEIAEKPEEYKLTLEIVKALWTKTYNTDGKPDWSHIMPYYDDEILFKDTIQEIKGKEDFVAMTESLTKRSKGLNMELLKVLQDENDFFLEWIMTIQFKKYPNSNMYGASRLTINEQGKIIYQRDYYDLWGDIFDNIPRFHKMYRRFMKRKFG